MVRPTATPIVQPVTQPVEPGTMPAPIPGAVIAPGSIQQPPKSVVIKPDVGLPPIWVFANPSGVALGPTSAQLNWKSREGATSYRVWRNGVAIADVASKGEPALRLVDTGLLPNSLNSYKVWALQAQDPRAETKDRSGTLLEESNTTSIGTPAILPPSNITATFTFTGQNVVHLSWSGASGAVAYRLFRDNQVIQPGMGGGAFDDTNVLAGNHVYSVQSLYPAPGGVQINGAMSSPVKIHVGPFNVLAMGDSVMWGQGLADAPGQPHKFTSRVRDWLQSSLGVPVTLTSFAHSGATFTPGNNAQEIAGTPGEVPNSFPSITRQVSMDAPAALARAGVNPADVDLVLVDGCINDIGIATVLDPSSQDAAIASATMGMCGGMTGVLSGIRRAFPAAKVILIGYWGIVSQQSDLTAVASLMTAAGVVIGPAVAASLGLPLDPATGFIIGLASSVALKNTLVNHSTAFINASNAALTVATTNVNAQMGFGWISFVSPSFQATNAYAAPNSWLWLVPTDLFPKDEMFIQRQQLCGTVQFQSGAEQAKCVEASMGHPNVLGAQAYANAITAELASSLPAWKLAHAMTQHAP